MDVHLRSVIHPLLGRLRIGAPRLWPLSPELHTSDCSFACPGSSTWVDKVPSRDTPSLDLADGRGGVDPDNPQVARATASTPTSTTAASPHRHRSPRAGVVAVPVGPPLSADLKLAVDADPPAPPRL